MHELAIADALIKTVGRETERLGEGRRVLAVHVSAGALSCVSAEALRFSLELLAAGTCLEGARLEIDEPRVACICQDCHARTETQDVLAPCPACGSQNVRLDGGHDVLLRSIEVED